MELCGKKVLICGMALSGVAASVALHKEGARLFLHDRRNFADLDEASRDSLAGLNYIDLFAQNPGRAVDQVDMLVVSPGLPLDLDYIQKAKKLGKPVVAEIEIGYQLAAADLIAITGTNGKTTTTALTGEILQNSKTRTFVLGNIGDPISRHARETRAGDVIVAETAALQLDTIVGYHPKGAAILNITPDHLDRYGTMDRYVASKARIFLNQEADDFLVLNYDDPLVRELAPAARSRIVWFSLKSIHEPGVFLEDGFIKWRHNGNVSVVAEAAQVRIPGQHNLQNAMCAAALTLEFGVDMDIVAATLAAFPGVEHRIETVLEHEHIVYINDSKGTNPDATMKAIAAMDRPSVLILGGFDKHANFDALVNRLRPEGVKTIVVLGATKDKIVEAAARGGFTAVLEADDLSDAVLKAMQAAEAGDAVLLSPACASWDMYSNFEERGFHFKQLVHELTREERA